jgi:heterodisulfide reductase subunit C
MTFEGDIVEYLLKDVRLSKEVGLKRCIQCGNCTAACIANQLTPFNPRLVVLSVLNNQINDLLASDDLWNCFNCYSCNFSCPRNNEPVTIVQILKQLAMEKSLHEDKKLDFLDIRENFYQYGLCLLPSSIPVSRFSDEIGGDWAQIREKMGEIRTSLGLNPKSPRRLDDSSIEALRTILKLTGFTDKLEELKKAKKAAN